MLIFFFFFYFCFDQSCSFYRQMQTPTEPVTHFYLFVFSQFSHWLWYICIIFLFLPSLILFIWSTSEKKGLCLKNQHRNQHRKNLISVKVFIWVRVTENEHALASYTLAWRAETLDNRCKPLVVCSGTIGDLRILRLLQFWLRFRINN